MSTLTDDEILEEQDHTLIMGVLGVGTFVLGFLFLLVSLIWFLSYSCAPAIKSVWRAVSTAIFFIVALIMVYAPRTNRFENSSLEPDVSTVLIPVCQIQMCFNNLSNVTVTIIILYRYMTIQSYRE